MRQLMLSLDRNIFDPTSAVAQRMVEYGKDDELFILIPDRVKKHVDLSPSVHISATGGNKIVQYIRLKKMGLELMRKNTIDCITVQDPSFIGTVGRWLKKKTGAFLEMQVHGDFYGSDVYHKNIKDRIGYFFFGERNIRAADRVRVVGERVKQSMCELGLLEEQIVVEPVPLASLSTPLPPVFRDIKKEFPGHSRYFLFVGRMEKIKNADFVIDLFVELVKDEKKDFFLLILGEGGEKERLVRKVNKNGLADHIFFWGFRDPTDYYRTADCLLFPSQSEGYGMVPMEAHRFGLAIIMNDVGVAGYELKESECVDIIPVVAREKWKEAMCKI